MKTKENIILIGMPGAGKSTIGVVLAKVLGYHFVDADIIIQDQEKRLLHEIIEQEGVDGFLTVENRVNSQIEEERAVISTGGSVVYGREAMEHFSETGTIIYLKLGYESLKKRLGDLHGRGVVLREGQDLKALYEERIPLYEKYAHLTVEEDGLSVEETLQNILKIYQRFCEEKKENTI
ncbi:MAG: shikimate kinase [Eubacteriales bacterium]|nr:shikimate kinase [Eubacteriales bacterium]